MQFLISLFISFLATTFIVFGLDVDVRKIGYFRATFFLLAALIITRYSIFLEGLFS